MSSQHHYFAFAHSLRGLAALLVVMSHYLGIFWLNQPAVASMTFLPVLPPEQSAVPFYVAWLHAVPTLQLAPLGVALFFLVSGFVIPFSLANHTPAGFFVARFFRLVPTYMAGFAVTLTALWLGMRLYGQPWPFTVREMLIHTLPGLRDIAGSRNIDGIVWTLEVEVKFYLLLGGFAWVSRRFLSTAFGLTVFVAPALLVLFLFAVPDYPGLLFYKLSATYIVFMFCGTVFHFLSMRRLTAERALPLIGLLFALFLLAWRKGTAAADIAGAWSYGYALLLFAAAYAFPHALPSWRGLRFLAAVSYPLYVVHGVAGYVLLRLLMQAGFSAWMAIAIVFAVALAGASLMHLLIENPSRRLGKRLASRWLTQTQS